VLCGDGQAADVLAELAPLLAAAAAPAVVESASLGQAEDVLDSLVGHMARRHQPEDLPTPPDWQML
jgi:hypothetical protein